MKKTLLILTLCCFFGTYVHAQTAQELIGKWKLVKWTKKGKEKTVNDSTYQVFKDKNQFVSIAEGKEHKGKWKLSKDNQFLQIRSGLFVVDFKIDYFDKQKRVITADQLGTLEYEKAD